MVQPVKHRPYANVNDIKFTLRAMKAGLESSINNNE